MKLNVRITSLAFEWIHIRDMTEREDYIVLSRRKMKTTRAIYFSINGTGFEVPAGYEWNGASIPNLFWKLIGKPTSEKYALASLIHDRLHELRYNRDKTDLAFKILLEWAGVPVWKVALMYASVRVGGHAFYAASADNNKLTTRAWRLVLKAFN